MYNQESQYYKGVPLLPIMRGNGMWVNYHTKVQNYKGIELKLIAKMDYSTRKAKCFRINQTDEVLWIPNKHLEIDGKIKSYQNLDYILQNQAEVLAKAGVDNPVLKNPDEQEG